MADRLVLCYHAVSERWPASLSVTPDRFDRQLHALRSRGYRGVTFRRLVTGDPAGDVVAITFDDAFRSVLDLAFPALDMLGWPGTLFVPTEHAGRPGPMSWDGIDRWIGTEHERELHSLSWDEMRELADAGWEIGSHTRTHPRLTEVDDAQLADELAGSRERCEQELRRRCLTLAYPYGSVDNRVAHAAGEAGYEAATTLRPHVRRPDPLLWPRVGVWHGDRRWRFEVKTSPVVRGLRARIGR